MIINSSIGACYNLQQTNKNMTSKGEMKIAFQCWCNKRKLCWLNQHSALNLPYCANLLTITDSFYYLLNNHFLKKRSSSECICCLLILGFSAFRGPQKELGADFTPPHHRLWLLCMMRLPLWVRSLLPLVQADFNIKKDQR